MLGAIIGDIAGSRFEFSKIDSVPYEFELLGPECVFTDDTVLTCAIAAAILQNREYVACLRDFTVRYPNRGYGSMFLKWIQHEVEIPLNSFGNGSAMRVSPIGWAFNSLDKTMEEAKRSAESTHNHPEGIKGAQATAVAIFLARKNKSKEQIKEYIERNFGYSISDSLYVLKTYYRYNEICQETVPASLLCFLEGSDYESCIRNAISLGGDTDTQAAITGAIAEAFYGIPDNLKRKAMNYLPDEFKTLIQEFYQKYISL